jgi:hypothetical protein
MVNNEYFDSPGSGDMGSGGMGSGDMGSGGMGSAGTGSSGTGSSGTGSGDMGSGQFQCSNGTMVSDPSQCPSQTTGDTFRNINEHFFPMQHSDSTSVNFNPMENRKIDRPQIINNIKEETFDKTCMQTYTPMFESVGDVCSPTATFKNELNAQGLNFPEGFGHDVYGSPLN